MFGGAASGKWHTGIHAVASEKNLRPSSSVTLPRCATSPSLQGQLQAGDQLELVPCDDDSLEEMDVAARQGLRTAPLSLPQAGDLGGSFEATSWDSEWGMRPGSGRFSPEELVCFRRVAHPSPTCKGKAQLYWQHVGDEKRQLSEQCWHSLPVLKGKFYSQYYSQERLPDPVTLNAPSPPPQPPKKKENVVPLLPDEALTGAVLEEIFPKSPEAPRKFNSEAMSSEREALMLAQRRRSSTADLNKIFKDDGKKGSKQKRQSTMSPPKPVTVSKGPVFTSTTNNRNNSTANASCMEKICQGSVPETANAEEMSGICAVIYFRKRLIEKFHILKDAFDSFMNELPTSKMMTKKEFRRILLRLGLDIAKEEREMIFDHLDLDGDAHVSMRELMMAVEASGPVKNMADLRRRWLVTGFRSMNHALNSMQESGLTEKRMNLREFGQALSYVYIMEQAEHSALFNIIVDPGDKQGKVSISELASAVATVSPALLLEDIRARCIKKYSSHPDSHRQHGSGFMQRAFQELQGSSDLRSNEMKQADFVPQAMRRLGLTELEACKVFRDIDLDGDGSIAREEFMAALSLCEPNIFLEDVRRKIRQRFRSIAEALGQEVHNVGPDGDPSVPRRLDLTRFQELLMPLELTEGEIRKVFNLIDVECDDTLTAKAFLQGTRLFAPSSVIEDLRLQCLYRHPWVFEAFADVDIDRSAPLTLEEFSQMLSSLQLSESIDVDSIFDMLDVDTVGSATLGNLVAALQAGGPGSSVKLQEEGLRAHAKQDVRKCISSAHTLVGDLKTQVRQGVRWPESLKSPLSPTISDDDSDKEAAADRSRIHSRAGPTRGKRSRPPSAVRGNQASSSRPATSLGSDEPSQSRPGTSLPEAAASSSRPATTLTNAGRDQERMALNSQGGGLQPRLRTFPHQGQYFERVKTPSEQRRPGSQSRGRPTHRCVNDNQMSWGNIWKNFKRCTGQADRAILEKDVQAYYQASTWRLSHDVPILKESHSRFKLHQNARTHYQKIASLSRRNQARNEDKE